MSKTAEEIIYEQVGIKPGASLYTPMDYGEAERCMKAYADQQIAEFKEYINHRITEIRGWLLHNKIEDEQGFSLVKLADALHALGKLKQSDSLNPPAALEEESQDLPIWYYDAEVEHWLIRHGYSKEIASGIAGHFATHYKRAFNKGYEKGVQYGKEITRKQQTK
jgi:hypothetical protein